MSFYDDVAREALHDWLDERRGLAADERPSSAELEDDLPDLCARCGRELLHSEGPLCSDCWERG